MYNPGSKGRLTALQTNRPRVPIQEGSTYVQQRGQFSASEGLLGLVHPCILLSVYSSSKDEFIPKAGVLALNYGEGFYPVAYLRSSVSAQTKAPVDTLCSQLACLPYRLR